MPNGEGQRLELTQFGNHAELGREIAKWATDKSSWPQGTDVTVAEGYTARTVADPKGFKKDLEDRGMVTMPKQSTKILFIQPDTDGYIIRLPPAALVQQSVNDVKDEGLEYTLPEFYEWKIDPDSGVDITNEDLLYSRIGDYTFARCM